LSADDRLLPESAADDALFRDAESALRWALQVRSRSPQRDTLAALRGSPAGRSIVTRADAPGQAGMILACLVELAPLDQALLILRLGSRARPCACRRACCSGWAVEPAWDAARTLVIDAAVEAFTGRTVHYVLRDSCVRRWAGQRVDLGRVADTAGVHRDTVGSHSKVAHRWLQPRYKRALACAEAALRREVVSLSA